MTFSTYDCVQSMGSSNSSLNSCANSTSGVACRERAGAIWGNSKSRLLHLRSGHKTPSILRRAGLASHASRGRCAGGSGRVEPDGGFVSCRVARASKRNGLVECPYGSPRTAGRRHQDTSACRNFRVRSPGRISNHTVSTLSVDRWWLRPLTLELQSLFWRNPSFPTLRHRAHCLCRSPIRSWRW